MIHHQHAPSLQRCADQQAALAVGLGLLAIEAPGQITLMMLGQRHGRGRRQRNTLVGRAEQHVEIDATVNDGRRVEAPQLSQCQAAVEQAAQEAPPGTGGIPLPPATKKYGFSAPLPP